MESNRYLSEIGSEADNLCCYKFEIVPEKDGTYFIKCPELLGCFSCGDTIEDAKMCWIESCLEEGVIVPEPKNEDDYSGNLRIRMPKTLHKNLVEKAEKEGISMN